MCFMKKYVFYILFMLLQAFNLFSDDATLFVHAQEKFVKGDFAGALNDYRSIKYKNSVVWQNIGSCYFNEQQYVQALLYWKRAYQRCQISQVAQLSSLEQRALQKLNLKIPSRFHFFVKRIVLMVPLIFLQMICMVLLCCILWTLSRCWRWQEFVGCDRRWLQWLIFGCFICGITWYAQRSFLQKDQAMVVKQDVLVYAGPERTFHVVETLRPGNVVRVIQKKHGMYNIVKHSLTGWVTQDTVEFIYSYE